ncbi:MAG: rod-binding protein [Lachnospiraceae bacterium]
MDISSLYTDYISQTANNTTANQLSSTENKDYSEATDDELLDVCKQFESYFLEQMFKQMEKTIIRDEESSDSNSTLVDYFKSNALVELSEQSTETNGLGIAQMLYEQMKRNYNL